MADAKLTSLTVIDGASAGPNDIVYLVHNPGSTQLSRQITVAQLVAAYERSKGRWDFVRDFGADNTGSSDCAGTLTTALNTIATAGGGTLYIPAGNPYYLFSGALQDTSSANAQVPLPFIGTGTPSASEQVSIQIVGCVPPPTSGEMNILPRAGYSCFRSTLTGASGTAAMFAHKSGGRNNLHTTWENLVFELPPNPTFGCLNLANGQDAILKNLLIHTGALDLGSITQPTHASAQGFILPQVNNSGAGTRADNCIVWGMYDGFKLGEQLLHGSSLSTVACLVAMRVPFAYHANIIESFMSFECPHVIAVDSGPQDAYLKIMLLDIENANGQYASWMNKSEHLDDSTDKLHGSITWHVVDANVGVVATFLILHKAGLDA